MTNLPGNRPGFTDGTGPDTCPVSGSDTGSLTDSSHVRAIASRPVPSLPDLSRPNPGAIPHNRDHQLNGNNPLSAVNAEVAGAREPAITRMQAIRIAKEMHAGGWRLFQISDYLAARGQTAHRTTIKRWVDPEYAARYRKTDTEQARIRRRVRENVQTFTVIDDDARARLAEQLAVPVLPVMTEDLMHTLRVEDGLSYNAIGKVSGRIFGAPLSADQVSARLAKRGVPKNPKKVRSAQKLNAAKAAA